MNDRSPERRRTTLRQRLQRLVQVRWWRMDIHPTAWIAPTALIDRTWPKGVHIGAQCIIDEEAVILTHDLTRGVYLDTRIGDRSVLGPRSIVLPGLTIGEDCIVSAGALVTRDMPANSIAIGNPATVEAR
jgi:acetyltransferase-like isoleucine patch superfamily enzyme